MLINFDLIQNKYVIYSKMEIISNFAAYYNL